jgi:hypothetical protein
MNNQKQFLTEALQITAQVVDTVEDRYREVAFPIILQALIEPFRKEDGHKGSNQEINGNHTSEPLLPPTLSVNEFFRRVNPDTHPARFVTAAYYLLHTGKAEQFTQADILEIYRRLRHPLPKNPTDVMNQCIRKAHIIDAPDIGGRQKQWVITPEGEKFVEGLLRDNTNSSNTIAG